MSKNKDMEILDYIFDIYKLSNYDRKKISDVILPIYSFSEFKKRMTDEFPHHGSITLGEHIIDDAIMTYLLSKKYINDSNFDIDVAIKIAMLHDLYVVPWQNNIENKTKYFFNKHGFRHPIEAVINAYSWYPELFKNKDEAEKIIDGIIHHMFPLPVKAFIIDNNKMELKNYDMLDKLPSYIIDIIIKSTNRGRIGFVSICPSKYIEGRVMAKADKYVSIRQIKNPSSALALVTGKNKKLKKK